MNVSDSHFQPKRVFVRVEEVPGGRVMATSNELRGLMVAANSVDELLPLVPEAIAELYEASGYSVVVTIVDKQDTDEIITLTAETSAVQRAALHG
jgi:hypothetical protein